MERALEKLSDKMDAMSAQIAGQSAQIATSLAKCEKIEAVVFEMKAEMAAMAKASLAKDVVISKQADQLNNCEQAQRSTSLRILGLPLQRDASPQAILDTVFVNVIQPVLEAAKAKGELDGYPSKRFIIDSAFTIPSKTPSSCPVIVKLSSSFIRSLIFTYKNDVLPKVPDPISHRIRHKFGIYEDLTPANFAHFRTLAEDARTTSIWTYNGQIKFRIKDSEAIYRVRSMNDTVDTIIKSNSRFSSATQP
jgi:hypothetical protein